MCIICSCMSLTLWLAAVVGGIEKIILFLYLSKKKQKNNMKNKNWAYELGKWQRLSSLTNNVIDINAIC